MYTTLISVADLFTHHHEADWLVVDCRCALADSGLGLREYEKAHIPGAVFAHLESDLSGPVVAGETGRHPLPAWQQAAQMFGRLGVGEQTQVVVYDNLGGALAAARAWWMLRWLGHEAVAVLDGGWQAWQRAGLAASSGVETRPAQPFAARPRPELAFSTAEVDDIRLNTEWRLVDVRTRERFRGEQEPIDRVAGHIPGAISAPYARNLTPDGTLRPLEELRAYYQRLLDSAPAERTVFYCGSGVTSVLSILALQYAGLGEARLYAGSWSEWIAGDQRPIATGD